MNFVMVWTDLPLTLALVTAIWIASGLFAFFFRANFMYVRFVRGSNFLFSLGLREFS